MDNTNPPDQPADELSELAAEMAREGQIEELQKKVAKLEQEKRRTLDQKMEQAREDAERRAEIATLRHLTSAENARQDLLASVREMTPLLEPPVYDAPVQHTGMPHHVWGLMTSDWQMGQRDVLAATGRVFEQSSPITKQQVREMWSILELNYQIQSKAKAVDELVIFSLGDLLEGDQMRASQAWGIDTLVTQQAIDVTDLLSWLMHQALAIFPRVRVLHVGGNHDRTSSKPGNAGLGELGFTDTYSWLIGEFLKRMHERAIDSGRLEFVNHESFYGAAIVANMRCVYEHGASFRSSTGSYGGVSYYSIANAATGYMKMLEGADLVLMGHHHVPMMLPMGGWGWQVMNGALPPSSSWVQSTFKGYRRPSQVWLDMHPERGLVGFHPIYLETAHQLRPGEFWESVRKDGPA